MMWLKRNLLALVVGLVFVAMIVCCVLLLRQVRKQRMDAETQLQGLQQQYEREISNYIFPSPRNLEILREQRRQMQDFFHDVYNALPKYEREYPMMPPWEFKGYLETQLLKMEQFCRTNQVLVPAGISFGFGRYVGSSQPPKREDTPALLHQLDLTERLLKVFVQSKVTDISSFRRTFLESETEASKDEKVDGGVWKKDAHLLYESQNFELVFRCSNDQLKTVLANLASSTNLIVLVRYVGVEVPKVFPSTPVDATSATTGSGAPGGVRTPTPVTGAPSGTMMPPMIPGMPPGVPAGRAGQVAQPSKAVSSAPADVPLVLGTELATVSVRLDVIEVKALDQNDEPRSSEKEAPKNVKKS